MASKSESIAAAAAAADMAHIDSLRKDLEAERRRAEKLDNLLLTNANLRKRLQDELDSMRSQHDNLIAQLQVAKGSAQADIAKHVAEANSYKQMYLQALEELSSARSAVQKLTIRATAAEDERDAMRRVVEEQTAELESFSPKRHAAAVALEYNIAEVEADLTLKPPPQLSSTIPPESVVPLQWDDEGDEKAHVYDDDVGGESEEAAVQRPTAKDLQRVVVGLYRRLKACEMVLHETNHARLTAVSKHVDLQREVEHLQRRLAVKSPMVVRREAAAAAAADVAPRSTSAQRRPVELGGSDPYRPVSASRGVSAARSPLASRSTSATKPHTAAPARPTSTAPSARSTSAVSLQSGHSSAVLTHHLRLNALQLRPKSPYGWMQAPPSRGTAPSSVATSAVPSRRVSPSRPLSSGPVGRPAAKGNTVAAPEVPSRPAGPAAFGPASEPSSSAHPFRAVLRGAFTEQPPVISRKPVHNSSAH